MLRTLTDHCQLTRYDVPNLADLKAMARFRERYSAIPKTPFMALTCCETRRPVSDSGRTGQSHNVLSALL